MAINKHTYDRDEKELEDLIRKDQDEAINKITNSNKSLSILVAGASNNGKSSIVSQVFGTNVGIGLDGASTTNGIKTYICKEKRLLLVDTPGLEKKNNEGTVAKLRECKPDILWLILNYNSSIEEEELNIAVLFSHVPTIVILNKVDTLQMNKLTDNDIEEFDSKEAILPDKLSNNRKLMATRQRLINWKSTETANIRRIVIMSLRNELPTDHRVGIINLCEATWASCDYVAAVTFAQAQQVWQGDKIKGSIGIITFSIALASGCAWIPIPGVDFATTAGIQWSMLCSLCKLWGMAGDNVKTFMDVMTRNVSPVIISLGISYIGSNLLKFYPIFGTIFGGSGSSIIAGTCTMILGSLATVTLKNIHNDHRKTTAIELEKQINEYMNSDRFKIFLDKIKDLAKNPRKIDRNELANLVQNG